MKKIKFLDKVDVVKPTTNERFWLLGKDLNEIKTVVNQTIDIFDLNKQASDTALLTINDKFKNYYLKTDALTLQSELNQKIAINTTAIDGYLIKNITAPVSKTWNFYKQINNKPVLTGSLVWSATNLSIVDYPFLTNRTTFTDNEFVTKKYVDDKQTTTFDPTQYISRAQWVAAATDAIAKQKWTSPEKETVVGTTYENSKVEVVSYSQQAFERAESFIIIATDNNNEQHAFDLEYIFNNTWTLIFGDMFGSQGSSSSGYEWWYYWYIKKVVKNAHLNSIFIAVKYLKRAYPSGSVVEEHFVKRKFKITFKQDIVSYLLEKINNL